MRALYDEVYAKFAERLSRCPSDGAVHELGSGGGYLRDVIPDAMTLHVLPYPGIENIVDGLGHRVALGGVSGCSGNALASVQARRRAISCPARID